MSRPFAYNTGSSINGTGQIGDLAIGVDPDDYSKDPGGVKWWNGPDEDLGYVIAYSQPDGLHPTPIENTTASVGFKRSTYKTEASFVELSNREYVQSFTTGDQAKTWLNNNGYWTSWVTSASPPPPPPPPPTLYAVSISTVYGSFFSACGGNVNITAYSTSNGYPQLGDIYYTNNTGTTTYGAGFYKNSYDAVIELDSSGVMVGGPDSCDN